METRNHANANDTTVAHGKEQGGEMAIGYAGKQRIQRMVVAIVVVMRHVVI